VHGAGAGVHELCCDESLLSLPVPAGKLRWTPAYTTYAGGEGEILEAGGKEASNLLDALLNLIVGLQPAEGQKRGQAWPRIPQKRARLNPA
jgi:hypothetical protein